MTNHHLKVPSHWAPKYMSEDTALDSNMLTKAMPP